MFIQDFQSLVFKAGYDYLKRGAVSMEIIRKLNSKILNHQPKTLADALDVLSYELLSITQKLAQTYALKLSLSHIIYFDGSTLEVFDEFFNRQDTGIKALSHREAWYQSHIWSMIESYFDKLKEVEAAIGESASLGSKRRMNKNRYISSITSAPRLECISLSSVNPKNFASNECPSHDADLARAEVFKMKTGLLVVKNHDKELVKKYPHPLRLIDGEHTSEATKDARNVNMRASDDDDDEKKDLIGRRIDLIQLVEGSDIEMCSSEWKKPATTAKVIEQQRIKNICTNSAILHNLSKLVHHDNLSLLGMDWAGFVGVMFTLTQVSDAHCVNILPNIDNQLFPAPFFFA
ncbi:uncharacterized protein EV154DRAFT_559555 [Mucor mucedo]|uniref:uncharacterized protein n=1 Tax=Mucor mucedo TaxID=29922 RepID=UPI00221FAD92|nr:uncharacterized protein EV154DRAFT_559555 [Mucor mucedo]KAI7895133.1 hypothetical protein EV154DRAFT_559555 [Mucor mucedo]